MAVDEEECAVECGNGAEVLKSVVSVNGDVEDGLRRVEVLLSHCSLRTNFSRRGLGGDCGGAGDAQALTRTYHASLQYLRATFKRAEACRTRHGNLFCKDVSSRSSSERSYM